MSRHGQEARSVSLFPFLAVLICAMGALIFLLVVTTRRIRQQAVIQVQQESVEEVTESDIFPPLLFAAEIEEPQDLSPRMKIVETPTVIPEPEPQVINLAAEKEAKLRALNLQKARRLEELKSQNLKLIQLKNELNQSESWLASGKQKYQTLKEKDEDLVQKMNQVHQQNSRAAELLQEELHNLQQKKQSQKTARSKYSVIPYDGQTGTAKRPILIECTDQGLTFIPEGITLTPDELNDFTPGYNPLLAGTQALFEYWKTKDLKSNQEPYVLILVRPSGSVGYYVARKLLNNLKLDTGYELIDADWEFELPDKDLNAEQVCQEAVDRVLSERKNLVSQLRQPQSTLGPRGRRLKFDPRTGRVRVIDPEEGAITGKGNSTQSEKLGANGKSKSSNQSRFSDVLTPRQQMTRAEYLRKVGNQKHIVAQKAGEMTGEKGSTNLRGYKANQGTGEYSPLGAKKKQDSRQRAEAYEFSELRKNQRGKAGEDSGVKQAKIMNREQLRELAEKHLVSLKASQQGKETNTQDQVAGQPDGKLQSREPRIFDNTFAKQGTQEQRNPTQSNSMNQQARQSQSNQQRNGTPPGQSSSGAGNSQSLSFKRSQQAGGARSESQSAKKGSWQAPRSGIGFEREITVQVGADRILVGEEKWITVNPGVTQEELLQSMIVIMDQHMQSWGPAPRGFYWVPTIQFTVSPGGNQYYERLKVAAQKMGLQIESTFTLEPLPVSSVPATELEK